MSNDAHLHKKPEILAPAGDESAFFAALAAGADAIYLGLKNFSARMEAENFGLHELSRLTALAHAQECKVYVAMNTMLKANECLQAFRLLERLKNQVECDGIIVQDLAFVELARKTGFQGKLFLSTLANVSHYESLQRIANLGVSRIILPRELSIDEIRLIGEHCPNSLDLEIFIHGALCYCVSGRCYWSSYMGGKSSLRGRCVQPCRRLYRTGPEGKENAARFFSCQDLSLDVLAKTLLSLPHLNSWKIEGRKKGAHYVFYTVSAYKMLRDEPNDSKIRRDAAEMLEMALGRPTTHAFFLPQKKRIPTDPQGITSSGLFIGRISHAEKEIRVRPRCELLPHDYVRVGTEEDAFHQTVRIPKRIGKGSNFVLPLKGNKKPPNGTPIFLIDRREKELIACLHEYADKLEKIKGKNTQPVLHEPRFPQACVAKRQSDMRVLSTIPVGKENRASSHAFLALWVSPKTIAISKTVARRVYWWLPPVVWPDENDKMRSSVQELWRTGARHYVLNAPWQRDFFPQNLTEGSDLVAGPFCNLANPFALKVLADMGFKSAIISPELSKEDIAQLPKMSPLPLGFVLSGFWPVGISRFGLLGLKNNVPFASPKGEVFWTRQYGENTWIYPSWPVDLEEKQAELQKYGYAFFVRFYEKAPQNVPQSNRLGLFNWDGQLF